MSHQFSFDIDDDDELIANEMAGQGAFASFVNSIVQDDGTLRFESTLTLTSIIAHKG